MCAKRSGDEWPAEFLPCSVESSTELPPFTSYQLATIRIPPTSNSPNHRIKITLNQSGFRTSTNCTTVFSLFWGQAVSSPFRLSWHYISFMLGLFHGDLMCMDRFVVTSVNSMTVQARAGHYSLTDRVSHDHCPYDLSMYITCWFHAICIELTISTRLPLRAYWPANCEQITCHCLW